MGIMARKDLTHVDASENERSTLEYILEQEKLSKDDTKYLSVEEAVAEKPVYQATSTRDETRVLFISEDESLLNPTQQTLDGYVKLSELFDEVHILILRQGIKTKTPVLRLEKNMWLYTAADHKWWMTPFRGNQLVKDQLVFADGFRPDIIVARDPFFSASLAIHLGQQYERPVQVHVIEDFTKKEFRLKATYNYWRQKLANYNLRRVRSIRTSTKSIYESLVTRFLEKDLALLPRYNNYEELMMAKPEFSLKDKYPELAFTILYIGKLDKHSLLYLAIDAARHGLKSKHIGLIVLGSGTNKAEFEKRAQILKVADQVIFEPRDHDETSYLKSASVLIVPETTPESEYTVLKAAAAGTPLLLAKTAFREDIFVDGVSALLCEPGATDDFSLKLNLMMNDFMLRRNLAAAAQNVIKTKFHEDAFQYKQDYRHSIEQVLFLDAKLESK